LTVRSDQCLHQTREGVHIQNFIAGRRIGESVERAAEKADANASGVKPGSAGWSDLALRAEDLRAKPSRGIRANSRDPKRDYKDRSRNADSPVNNQRRFR
jgi:hypothetical protein